MSDGGRKGKDWNLAFVALAFGLYTLVESGSFNYQLQYAVWNFHWGTTQMGLWLSGTGVGRAITLCFIVPWVTEYLSRNWLENPSASSDESLDPNAEINVAASESQPPCNAARTDLALTRLSVAVDFFCFLLALLSIGPISWTVGTQLAALSSGFPPFIQSLALSFIPQDESNAGALFAGLGVLQTICSGILGPIMFGTLCTAAVATFPKAMFALCALLLASAFSLVYSLRLPRDEAASPEDQETRVLLQN